VPRTLEVARQPVNIGYVEGIATSPDRQAERLGSLVMDQITRLIRDNFEMGALSTSRHGFYERLGWERWRGPTFARDGTQEIRTEQQDDGVIILRLGVSLHIDLTASLLRTAAGRRLVAPIVGLGIRHRGGSPLGAASARERPPS
jgi:aminoglycoside 2'-N-acetyltransferase I